MTNINYWAVLVSAIASFALGGLWYSPILFGRKWAHLMGMSMEMTPEKKRQATRGYIATFIGALVMAWVLAHFVNYTGVAGATGAVKLALKIWLGFVATIGLTSVFFESRKWTLYSINQGFRLVELVIMSLILTLWR